MTTPGPRRNLWNVRKGAASKPQFIMGEAPFEFRTLTEAPGIEMAPVASGATYHPHTVNLTTSPTPKPSHVGAAPQARPWRKDAEKMCVDSSKNIRGSVVVTEHDVPPPPAGIVKARVWSSPTPPPPGTEDSDEPVVCDVDKDSDTSNDTGSDTSNDTGSDTSSDAEPLPYRVTGDTIMNILIGIMVANHLMHFLSSSALVVLDRAAATILIGYTIHFGLHMTGHTNTYTDGSAKAHVVALVVTTLCKLRIS